MIENLARENYPLGQLRVHHKVVNMFFRFCQLELSCHYRDDKCGARCSLKIPTFHRHSHHRQVRESSLQILTMMPVIKQTPFPQ